jgi:hypothetical protein
MGKKGQSEKFNLKYFTTMVGLSSKGLSPRHMDPKYVNLEECEKVWGRRCSNNHGFKYKISYTYEDVIAMG